MFWVAIKVLFFRQAYGFKHRWIMTLSTLVYTLLILGLLPLVWLETPSGGGSKTNNEMFSETGLAGIPNPLMVVVTPHNLETQQLFMKAYRNLESKYANNSLFNVHVKFMESAARVRQTLEKSIWPSIGVQFHVMTDNKLEYTLSPVIDQRILDFSMGSSSPLTLSLRSDDDEFFHGLLQLQIAIDAAYIQTHFPNQEYLRIRSFPRFPSFDQEDRGGPPSLEDQFNFTTVHFLVAISLLFMMSMLATNIIRDKLSGVRELLCVNGLPRWMVNTSWLVCFSLIGLLVALIQFAFIFSISTSKPYLKYLSPSLLVVFLIVYGWTALVFVNFLANLLTSQLMGTLVILAYWLASTIVSRIVIQQIGRKFVTQGFISMLPNFGYTVFLSAQQELRKADTELSFKNLFSTPENYISAGLALVMMLVGIFIFLALALYLDAVKPGPYGRARPWYLFTFNRKNNLSEVRPGDADDTVTLQDERFFEQTNNDAPIGLKCVNIVKIFGSHKALNNVNLEIEKNKVTVLLGHNGAGKTTLFSILCGMFSPTSGDVYTDEYSIFEDGNIHKFRKVLGYCPQENLVLNELSVQEHLIIFGMLKGLTKSEAREFSDKWTRMFGMYKMRHTQARKLSGGTKRKLCLAIAMTGDPEFLLLDEPSAGMDIESTRKMWDVLLEEKGNCTVIITTHNMDEADILGDRIAILAFGQLKCHGSSAFLKKTLDSGYRLNCSVPDKNTQEVVKAVRKTISRVSVLYKTNRSVTFNLPSSQMSKIPDLLRGLESQFGESVSSTLAISTLDDVFIKVQKDMGVNINVEELPTFPEHEMRRSGCNFLELFEKRVKWMLSKRIITMIFWVILLPSLSMIGGMMFIYSVVKQEDSSTRSVVNFSPSEHHGMIALVSNQHNEVSDLVRSAVTKFGITIKESSKDLNSSLIDIAQKDLFEYRSKLLFALDIQESGTPIAYFRSTPYRSVSLAYSALINALLQGNASIITHSASIWNQQNMKEVKTMCPINREYREIIAISFFLVVGLFMLTASAYFIVFPHEERTSLFKHLQLMNGLLPAVYWLVNLLFDMLIYLCGCVLLIIIIASMDHMINLFLETTVLTALTIVLILYGLSSILISYVFSFFFRIYAIPLIMLILVTVVDACVFALLSKALPKVRFEYSYFLPWPILWNSVHKILIWAFRKRNCDLCHDEKQPPDEEGSCDWLKKNPMFAKLKIEFIGFIVLTLLYFLVLMFFDHGLGRKLMGWVQRLCFGKIDVDGEVDPEVALEKERVHDLLTEDDQPELVCNGLGKKYSCKRTAVYDVTFTAERGECFGLVGVNGAGKTTTFGMLSALLSPTKGTAIIEGQWKVTGCEYNYLKRVGYCPQYEGLLRELPARTIIKLFGRLGGVPRSQIAPLVDKWINALDMNEIANRPCGHYSGGNKRKLSLAMALIGNPPVVLLDEPTAGVDPVVRRKIWEILTTSLENNERTIILTSHTMSECEAICDRLTIMVKGVMKCLGPIPVLKKTFGRSCILEVKFTVNSTPKQQNALQSKIESNFAGYIQLHDRQPYRLIFFLKTENVKMYDVFAAMLKIKSDNGVIDDFNLSETPLEQVFMMFAQNN